MTHITVIGGTGYAGSAIVEEARTRGHQVTSLSNDDPRDAVPGVVYIAGDATNRSTLASVIADAEVVVTALASRGPLVSVYRDVHRMIAELAEEQSARLFLVGGYSSLRPASHAERFVADLSDLPAAVHDEVLAGAAVITEDLPATAPSLNWVFVSPALQFGAHVPSEPLGRYQLGGDVAVDPETGGVIAVADYAAGFLDLIERHDHHRAHLNLGNPA